MILLSPAKTFNLNKNKTRNDVDYFNYKKTNTLYRFIHDLSFDELGEYLSIKNKTHDNTYKYYHEHQYTFRAIDIYKGIAFKEIQEEKNYEYVEENLYIIDAYYGFLNGCSYIHPYRLDFTNKMIIHPEDWKEEINDHILNELKPNYILNLASNEFSTLLNRDKLGTIIYDIEIKSESKISSTYLKKIRGQIFNYMMINKIQDLNDLINIETELLSGATIKNNIITFNFK